MTTSPIVRAGTDRWFKAAQELILLAMLTAAPWAFGAEEPAFQGALLAGVAVLALLGGVRFILSGHAASWNCPVALALGGLILLSGWQLLPLPPAALQVLSPASNSLIHELLPDRHESFLGESPYEDFDLRTWRPISLNPPGTRWFLIQLLALFLVAVIVRQQLAGPGFFHRLRWTAFLNGSALSLFALAQAASSPSNVVYWTFATEGSVYGPFICRNHFPFYLSLCIGLSLGLLARGRPDSRPFSFLQDPRRLWIVCGLALMGVACLFSLSRGAVASMAIAAGVVVLISGRRLRRGRAVILPIVGLLLAALLAAWLGLRSVENRLATLRQPGAGMSERLAIWRNVLPHLTRFPIFGSGNGTFALMEPIYRTQSSGGEFYVAEFAHNEYLEAAFEGGILRLTVTLALAITLVILLARAIRADSNPQMQLALTGGLWSILTIAIHSVVDFGLHMPAIALLATIAAVEMLTLAASRWQTGHVLSRPARRSLALVAMLLSLLLANEGLSTCVAEHDRRQATALSISGEESDRDRQLDYWETALLWRPRDAQLQLAAGQAYLQRLSKLQQADDRRNELRQACRCALAGADSNLTAPANLAAELSEVRSRADPARENQLRQVLLFPAAKHLLAARDLCPMLADVQYQLAEVTDCFAIADQQAAYLRRAALLRPAEPAVWYALGRKYRKAGDGERATAAWRRCLELSDRYLPQILTDSRGLLSFVQIRDRLLPQRAESWLAAADVLFPESGADERRPFLQHGLQLVEARGDGGADAAHQKATIQRELRLFGEAEASFRLALRQSPGRHDWRLEFVRMLRQLHRPADAKTELEIILSRDPHHREANELLLIVRRESQFLGERRNH